MKNDKNAFLNVFDDSNVMDFWNNYQGRTYAQRGFSSANKAFDTARGAGVIILLESDVTELEIDTVWRNDWYSY